MRIGRRKVSENNELTVLNIHDILYNAIYLYYLRVTSCNKWSTITSGLIKPLTDFPVYFAVSGGCFIVRQR